MKTRPILMSAQMVRAILNGTKTQTRRVLKPQPERWLCDDGDIHYAGRMPNGKFHDVECDALGKFRATCPYGQPGNRLWVRETFFDTAPFETAPVFAGRSSRYAYRADDEFIGCHRWSPSIHMPRAASRILLEITAVRVVRLKDISNADAIDEGLIRCGDGWRGANALPWFASPAAAYRSLWESINGPGSWDANPWVWVVEFKRVMP
ncbi:hypothetical protein [Denitromonas sp.]|uniref:hypothetical protein n=1 Tax=Denitromonas sp. TaxID=2734609 RepID=UPI003A8983D7